MRRAAIIVAIVVVLVVAAGLALPYLFDVNRYHDRIQAEIEKRLGRQTSLGAMRLSLFPFAIRVQGATIAEDPSFGEGKVFARTEELYVRADLLPLLRGDVRLRALELERPQIEVVRNAGGVWNFASLGQAFPAKAPPGSTPEEQARAQQQRNQQGPSPQDFTLDRLRIRNGQVAITDYLKQRPRTLYDHIDLAIVDYRPGQAFPVTLAAHFPGTGKQTARLNGTIGPIAENDALLTPFDGKLNLEEVSLAALQRFLNADALPDVDGTASGEATVKSVAGVLAASGSLHVEQGRVRAVDLGYPVAADYELQAELNGGVIRINKGTLKLGTTPLSVTGVINTSLSPVQIDVRVWTPDAPIQDLARLASAFGVAFDSGVHVEGRVQADVQAKGAVAHPLLNGSLTAKSLTITGRGMKRPAQVQGLQLTMTPEAVRSNDFAATAAGTTIAMQFSLTQYTTANPQVQANLRANGAQIDDVLNLVRASGAQFFEGTNGTGRESLDLHAAGAFKNAAALTLSGTGMLENAKFTVPSLSAPVTVSHADLHFAKDAAVLQDFAGAIGDANATGTVTVHNSAAPQLEFAFAVDRLNLNQFSSFFRTTSDARTSTPVRMSGHGKVTIDTVQYDQVVMTNAKIEATLDRGLLRLAPFTAEVDGGVQTGSIIIDTRTSPTQYAVNTRLDRVDANKLLSTTTSLKQVLFGTLAANANTAFTAGSSYDQLARSLNGNVALDLRNGKIANMDLWYEIATVGRFLSTGQKMQPFTELRSLTGNFNIQNGVARTTDLKAVLDGATVVSAGTVGLADQSLNLRAVAVLSRERSQQVGGSGIAGFMMTALADRNGQLILPVIISGTLSNPQFTPDLQRVAEMKLQQTISDPLGTAGGILGTIFGTGKRQPPPDPPPSERPR